MYYSRSRSPAPFSEGRNYNNYGKGNSFNYTSDFSLPPRNPSIQRVLHSDFGISERSISPVRDYNSPVSRITAFRPLPNVLSSDTSPSLRRRDLLQNTTLSESRSSPVSFLNEDLSYSPKSRNYFDFPTSSVGMFTSYSSTIKKPQRIDYSDYLRPVLTARPTLKSGYVPKSRKERKSSEIPIVRERKLIKFREMTNDILSKVRRKISWDLPEEISSPLIDEMKQANSEVPEEKLATEQKRSRENSSSRRGSNEKILSSPASDSPKSSISRRSSGAQILDDLSGIPLRRRFSPRSNGFISPPTDSNFSSVESKDLNINVHCKAPIAPPRKKSIGSSRKSKKARKSSVEILLSEEKSLNFSKIANDIRRSREASEGVKSLKNDASKQCQAEVDLLPNETDASNVEDSKSESNFKELTAINESGEVYERGRRRRRRDMKEETYTSEEKQVVSEGEPPDSRIRCRNHLQSEVSDKLSGYPSSDSKQEPVKSKYKDDMPQPVNRMHRKSVKYKHGSLPPPRRKSKSSDMILEPSISPTNDKKYAGISSKNEINFDKINEEINDSNIKNTISRSKTSEIPSKKSSNAGENESTPKVLPKQKMLSRNLEKKNLAIEESVSIEKALSSLNGSKTPKVDIKAVQAIKTSDRKIDNIGSKIKTENTSKLSITDELKKSVPTMPLNKDLKKETAKADDKYAKNEEIKLDPEDKLHIKESNIKIKNDEIERGSHINDSKKSESLGKVQPKGEVKETEEIVVVCKLPPPKNVAKTISSIPSQQNIVVSIGKNCAIKTIDVKESKNETLNSTSKAQAIIPIKSDGGQSIVDKRKKIETPEVNVTHTIVLKPKFQNTATKNSKLDVKDGKHLKAIPDVIKSTVSSNAKTCDVSDIVNSTLTEAKLSKAKPALPEIKSNNLFTKSNTENISDSPTTPEKGKATLPSLNFAVQNNLEIKEIDKNTSPKQSEDKIVSKTTAKKILNDLEDSPKKIISQKPDLLTHITECEKVSNISKDNSKTLDFDDQSKTEIEKGKMNGFKSIATLKGNDIEYKNKLLPDLSKQKVSNVCESGFLLEEIPATLQNKSLVLTQNFTLSKVQSSNAETTSPLSSKIKAVDVSNCQSNTSETIPKYGKNFQVNLKIDSNNKHSTKHFVAENISEVEDNRKKSKLDKIILPEVVKDNLGESTENMKIRKSNEPNLPLNEETKRSTSAYKKSQTLPNVNVLSSLGKGRESSGLNDIKNRTEETSLSSSNIPVTFKEKIAKTADKLSKEKCDSDSKLIFKSKKESNAIQTLQEKKGTEAPKNTLQLHDMKEEKSISESLVSIISKPCVKESFENTKESDIKSLSNASLDKKETVAIENKPKSIEIIPIKQITKSIEFNKNIEQSPAIAGSESCEKVLLKSVADASKQTDINTSMFPEKAFSEKNENIFVDDGSKSRNKNALKDVQKMDTCEPLNSLEKPKLMEDKNFKEALKSSEEKAERELKNSNKDNFGSVADKSALDFDTNQKPANVKSPLPDVMVSNSSDKLKSDHINSGIQNSDSCNSLITRVGSVMKKGNVVPVVSSCDEISKSISNSKINCSNNSNSLQKPEEKQTPALSEDRDLNENVVKRDTENSLKSDKIKSSKPENEISITNESLLPKLKKLKEEKPLPAPPPTKRIGLFLKPKEPTETIFESSSSSSSDISESETESESEDDETVAVNKLDNLVNGKSPERSEKNRNRNESNASIYSNLSNATTCTTVSTFDDNSSDRPRNKTLKFRKYDINDFSFLKLLGKGSFGKVLLAELKDTEMYFAIKCLKKDVVLEDDDVESTMIERRVLALGTQHPYMCKLYCTFQTKSYLFFVMEYLNGGDLMFHIQENRRFDEKRALFYGAEIVSALKFLHKRGIVYRDIKLDNVMLDEQGHVRLVDFGMCQCRVYSEECMPSNFCGTPTYIAPEIILGQKYNQSVDWWSFGILLYEMLTGRSPFHGTDEDELFWSICNEEPHYPRFLTREAIHLLGLLLVKSPVKRLGMSGCPTGDIKDHAFFSTINWDKIEKKQIPPPFKPSVASPCDTRNFDSNFTMDSPTLSPVDNEVLESMDQEQFHGFSYTNPHITG